MALGAPLFRVTKQENLPNIFTCIGTRCCYQQQLATCRGIEPLYHARQASVITTIRTGHNLVEVDGFEPPRPLRVQDLQSRAIGHYAIPP